MSFRVIYTASSWVFMNDEKDFGIIIILARRGSVSRIWRLKGFAGEASLRYSSTSTATLTSLLTPQVLAKRPKLQ